MKTTRRELGLAAAAAALALNAEEADAQAQPANQRNSDALAKFEIPIATEPAFRFEP